MALRRSYTAVVERNVLWTGEFATEPYEAAWASEAIFFLRALDTPSDFSGEARAQISADGIHWVDEGTSFALPAEQDAVTFCRLSHFGGWLRLVGTLSSGNAIKVIVTLVLKE